MLLNHAKFPKQCYQKRAKRHKNCAHQVAERTKSLPNNSYPQKTPNNVKYSSGRSAPDAQSVQNTADVFFDSPANERLRLSC